MHYSFTLHTLFSYIVVINPTATQCYEQINNNAQYVGVLMRSSSVLHRESLHDHTNLLMNVVISN